MSNDIESTKKDQILQAYLDEMEFIKLRVKVIDNLLLRTHTTGFQATDVESMVLQMRKILETIILSSLIVSKEKYNIVQTSIVQEWDPTQILKRVKSINPDFYPKPLIPNFNEQTIELVSLTDGYLPENEFCRLYGECGSLLHIPPLNKPKPDYTFKYGFIRENLIKIENLLKHHLIQLHTGLAYVIHMSSTPDRVGPSIGTLYIDTLKT